MPTSGTPHPPALPLVEPAESGVSLRLSPKPGGEILLSIEQARALSLALIAAVNRQEREARSPRAPARHAPQPEGR